MRTKKAVSEVIGYVLLISISLTLASLVFVWLKGYLPNDQIIECDENVALIIQDFNYSCGSQSISLTIKNRGLFNVDGYILRVDNKSGRGVGFYPLNKTGKLLKTGEVYQDNYSIIQTDEVTTRPISGNLTLIEIQPILIKKGKPVYCSNFISKQTIPCS